MTKNIKIKKHPTKNEIVKGKIANALTSSAKNHIVATTDDIYDTNLLEYQDEINKSLDSGITEILDELQYVAKEDTLVAGVSNIINDVDSQANTVTSTINSKTENIIDTVNGQANAVIDTVNSQAGNVINSVNTNTTNVVVGQAHGIQDNINAKTTDILNTVNAQAQAISTSVVSQTGQIISNNNQQTSAITSTVNQQAQSTNSIINSKTGDIINTVNAQAQSLANDIANLDNNLDSGVTRIFDAINLIKEELQGQNSAITLTYLYDTLGDLSTLLDEINGEEMPVEFATDYARQGENSGATNTVILDAIQELTSIVCSSDNDKEEIVDAINYVGGTAVSNMSWSELAQVIKNLNVV